MSASPHSVCPICGGQAWRAVLGGPGFRIEECVRGCIGRTVPPPEYSPDLPPDAKVENLTAVDRGKSGHFTYADRILDLIQKSQPTGRLLDVGSGWGQLLRSASDRGYDAIGIEASPGAAQLAHEAFGVQCVVGSFPDCTFEPGAFEVAVMNHVLEHVDDPRAILGEVERVLRPGGILAVCVPDFGGLMRRIKGVRWQGLQPSQHVWQLSVRSVKTLMERAGLTPVLVSRGSLIYERGTGSLPKWIALRMTLAVARLSGQGDNLIVLARKADSSPVG